VRPDPSVQPGVGAPPLAVYERRPLGVQARGALERPAQIAAGELAGASEPAPAGVRPGVAIVESPRQPEAFILQIL